MLNVKVEKASKKNWYTVKVEGHDDVKYIMQDRQNKKWHLCHCGDIVFEDMTKREAVKAAVERIVSVKED